MTDLKKILIADDEEDITWALARSLKNSKPILDVRCVNTGTAALKLIKKERFDLVISDVRMPGCDGMALVSQIRKLHPDTRVIIITAYGSNEVMERSDDLGSYFYLEKPFDIGYLRQIVFSALNFPEKGFKGSIETAGIHDLVQLYCSNKSNSSLCISRRETMGTIYFRDGDIVHAECGQLYGERAFYNMLNWNNGTFKVRHDDIPMKRTISRDWKTLLHQCA